jgi:RNA polymerase sigma factor (sigma-70 family)
VIDASMSSVLVAAAVGGDQKAWNDLVERYTPLVMSVIRRYRLSDQDAADVNQTLWLRLVEHLDEIREPRALTQWIITTTRNECLRLLRSVRRTRPFDPQRAADLADGAEDADLDAELLKAERQQVLREAFAQLPRHCQTILALLVADPPMSYAQISERLDMPVGSIGPTRARCLDKLRDCPAIVAFVSAMYESQAKGGDRHDAATLGR